MEQQVETLGYYLKQERESRRVTIHEMEKATQMTPALITALEENRYQAFSRREHIPGFLRLYSRYLCLNEEEIIKRYNIESASGRNGGTCHDASLLSGAGTQIEMVRQPRGFLMARFQHGVMILTAAFCVVAGIILFAYVWLEKPSMDQNPISVPQTTQKKMHQASTKVESAGHHPLNRQQAGQPDTLNPSTDIPFPPAVTVIANSESKFYHLPGMKYYDKVKAYHRVVFESEKEAIQAGYQKAPH